jgi:hypothetical protein
MAKETKTKEKAGPWQYTLGVFMGSGIIVGYLVGAIMFILYLLAIIARTYIWIDKFSIYGIGWGVILGLLTALGAIAATIVGLIIVLYFVKKFREFRERRR